MRQRGERGYREDERDYRQGERGSGPHRSGMGGGEWERGRSRNRAYDEAFDELENSGYGGDYRREQWGSDYNDRGGFGELDEGRFQTGRGRILGATDWDDAYSSSRGRQSGRFGEVNPSDYNRPAPGNREGYGRSSQDYGRYGQGQGGAYGRFGTWGFEGERQTGERGQDQYERGSYGRSAYQQGGQRGLHSGKGPQGYQRSDARIQEDLCDLLTEHPEIDASNIEVKVEGRNVTLCGTVDSRQTKRLAEDIAEDITGVQDVRNELRVQRNQGDEFGSNTQRGGSEASRHKTTK